MAAALPLIALAIVPATLQRPQLPYLQGLILFVLLAAFMWSERTAPRNLAGAIALAGVAGLVGVILAPGLDQRHPWLNYNHLTSSLAAKNVDTFDWSQTYGPLNWPQHGRPVLDVRAARPDYWKSENLEVFNGLAWLQGVGPVSSQVPGPAPWAVSRWTQTLAVTIRQMKTTEVIAAGTASEPQHVGEGVGLGVSAGTWTTAGSSLQPGDSYTVSTYSPRPTGSQLGAVSATDYTTGYPASDFVDELTIGLPSNGLTVGRGPEVLFAPFHSGQAPQDVTAVSGGSGLALIEGSAYARAYALATRLAADASTPYAFVRSVKTFLSTRNGFSYDQNPPLRPYPLESFLFGDKRGYCQQFAGAMALLLRMGGVPARVATGFTTGRYDSASHRYVVNDTDAHAWVEAWFPGYGWVRFDPTPPAAPAISGGASLLSTFGSTKGAGSTSSSGLGSRESRSAGPGQGSHGGAPVIWIVLGVLLVVSLGGGVLAVRRGRARSAVPSSDELVAELERALARTGRPVAGGTTLIALERRFHAVPTAASYVRALRLARFAGAARLPSVDERRALRTQLALGLGMVGRLRAWWALPPRFLGHRRALH
jgi:transglutaminase-like putative cysteine protease